MLVSEMEVEARLRTLREQRDALDREIADLALYLELGRRLGSQSGASAVNDAGAAAVPYRVEGSATAAVGASDGAAWSVKTEPRRTYPRPWQGDVAAMQRGGASLREDGQPDGSDKGAASGEAGKPQSAMSENALARRYGKELIGAALEVLAQTGRPLHASEILAELTARNFSVPGHDPVAALNTRLWKRSGPDGPLRQLGDAIYVLAERETDPM